MLVEETRGQPFATGLTRRQAYSASWPTPVAGLRRRRGARGARRVGKRVALSPRGWPRLVTRAFGRRGSRELYTFWAFPRCPVLWGVTGTLVKRPVEPRIISGVVSPFFAIYHDDQLESTPVSATHANDLDSASRA